jgi:hypothetical protein
MSRQVIWRSTDAPKQERYVVRVVYPGGTALETSHKRLRAAEKDADGWVEEGVYVEIIDTDSWRYWG